jgi:asparagine synthase (glutamine-hydrolysing)
MAHVAADSKPHLREASDWRHAFIASFPGQSNDETPEAMEAAAYAGVTPHVLSFEDKDPLAQIDTILADLDEVYIGLPTAPWQIYRELRSAHTLVSLDGHGADELMGGYRQAGQSLGFALRNHAARLAQGSVAIQHAIDSVKLATLSARGLNFLRGHTLIAPRPPTLPSDSDILPSHWGPLNRRLYRMFHGTVLPTILRNFDRLSMAHGVEVRMPFMDWRLVTYVMSLPDDAKSEDGRTKAVARNAMAGFMPDSIRMARRKVGFNSPMPEWLNGALGRWATSLLSRPESQFDALVDRKALLERVNGLNASRRWDWEQCGRLWPYLHLKWYLEQADASK